ncbi:MAG TPA: DUF1080 domain-containing protein [Bacteroidetes bacterium]|nr:DUF1080 domain-containing protein [Bacteroidota bacterium]
MVLPLKSITTKQMKYLLFLLLPVIGCQSKTSTETTAQPTAPSPAPLPPNTLSEEEKAAGWELLFDGKNTSKWRGYNKPAFPSVGWKIMDGTLAVEHSGTEEAGHGGDIITKDKYENFELSVDFLLSDTANSGIFYRVVEVEGEPIWHNAPEYQLLDDKRYAEMGITNLHFTAANYDLHPAEKDYTKPIGEWNTAHIIVNHNHVEHRLNGHLVVAYDLESPEWEALVAKSKFKDYPRYGRTRNGHLGLQDHGHLVLFRNIKVRRL